MTDENAERAANIIIGAAAAAVVTLVVRTPALRRLAWRMAVTAVTGTAPAWLAREVRTAWAESAGRTA